MSLSYRYVAGFSDGEGYIGIAKTKRKECIVELVHDERVELDKAIEQATKKKCDEGVHMIPDIVFVQLVDAVICKMRKNRKSKITNNLDEEILNNVEAEEIPA